ncbi:MAG: HAMP domain-containing histidine kinase, partial [Gammaproteobacteria bacterium]|nr:HAMP domain-containing histidine kinase [Gammaproteobacteria bacterium]
MKRKKMEEALFQSEKLKSIGTITAGIAHEFNNILAIIFGNVQLLEETYKDHGELIGGLRIIGNAAKDGAEISNKMLTFTKRNEDTTDYSFMELVELLKEAIDFTMPRWKNMAQAKGVNYSMDMEGIRNSYYLMCNPTEIREVFVNIINNALDAMPGGGCISFSTWREDD